MTKVAQIQAELADREAIRQCIYRYCRGIDRCDAELLRTVFWPDATDDHVTIKINSAESFINSAIEFLLPMDQTQHFVGNILINLVESTAYVETYYQAYHRRRRESGEPYDLVTAGRYVDRMERRSDEWRVAKRVVVRDWFREYVDSADWAAGVDGKTFELGKRYPDDRSYVLLDPGV